jgi:hypothetical protein
MKYEEFLIMKHEEFLQIKADFVDDLTTILELKAKWELPLTGDEKMLRRHVTRYRIERVAKLLGIEQ